MVDNFILLVILLLSAIIVHRKFRLTNIANPFVVFYWYHAVFFYIAVFYSNLYSNLDISIDTSTKYIISVSMVLFVFGGVVSKAVLCVIGLRYVQFESVSVLHNDTNKKIYYVAAMLLFVLGSVIVFYYVYSIGGYIWFSGNFENLRIESRKGIGFLVLASINLITFSGLILLVDQKVGPKYFVYLIVVGLLLLAFGNRAPFLVFLLALLAIKMMKSRKPLSLVKLAIAGGAVFLLMVVFGVLRKGPEEVYELFIYRFPWRPYVNILNFQVLRESFPSSVDFLYGRGVLIELSTLLPGYQPNLGTWVKDSLGMTFEGGSLTLSYIGVGYINFGAIGLILFPLGYGFALNAAYMLMVRRQEVSSQRLIIVILVSLSLGGGVSTGLLPVVLYTTGPILAIYLIYHLIISAILVGKTTKRTL